MVYNRMKDRLKRDKAKTHVLAISQLGLMEMTRQRAQESLTGSMFITCPYCNGRAVVKSPMTMSVEIQRALACHYASKAGCSRHSRHRQS